MEREREGWRRRGREGEVRGVERERDRGAYIQMCRRGERERKRERQGLGLAVDHMVFRPLPCDDGSDGSVLFTPFHTLL